MYKRHLNQIDLLDEPEYFGGIALDKDNEWVKLAKMIPWHEFENEYAEQFSGEAGQPACSVRMALGSLLIKERYQFSDGFYSVTSVLKDNQPANFQFLHLETEKLRTFCCTKHGRLNSYFR